MRRYIRKIIGSVKKMYLLIPYTPSKPYIVLFVISLVLAACFSVAGINKLKKGIAIISFILILMGIIREIQEMKK